MYHIELFNKSHSLRKEAVSWSGGTAVDTSISFARRQQGSQTVAQQFVFTANWKMLAC